MVSIKKRLVALLMTLVMALGLSVSAFAAEPVDVTQEPTVVASEEVTTRATGAVIAGGSTTIYGGSGKLSVYLSSGNFWADLVGQIDSISEDCIVSVSVMTPDGDYIPLGNISGNGSRTSSYEIFYAPSGTYTFSFFSVCSTPYDVAAFIYD